MRKRFLHAECVQVRVPRREIARDQRLTRSSLVVTRIGRNHLSDTLYELDDLVAFADRGRTTGSE